jgi:flagellin
MSEVTLSAGVRANLLALQATSDLMGLTQSRLATGHRVSTALDNPASFFTARALDGRAGDLNALLDGIQQARQSLSAADTGLSALAKLVVSAQALTQQARQAAVSSTTYGAISVNATTQPEIFGTVTGTGDLTSFGANGGNLVISFAGAPDQTIALANGDNEATILNKINTVVGTAGTNQITATADASHHLVLTAKRTDVDFSINTASTDNTTTALGLVEGGVASSTSLLDLITGAGGANHTSTLKVAVNGGGNQTITFGTGAGEVSTMAELNAALVSLGGVNAGAAGTSVSFNVAASVNPNSLQLTASAGVDTALGIANGTTAGVISAPAPNAIRAGLQDQYNAILAQIDALARDASYSGINLLNGDNLAVALDETGNGSLAISGVTFDAAGLGLGVLSGNEFQSNPAIDGVSGGIDAALAVLRRQSSAFGSNLATVQIRQDFTKAVINTLQTGADGLTLADSNEEGANLLALQTRQQLSITALSLSSRADQAMLRLF